MQLTYEWPRGVITSAEQAVCVHGNWIHRHVWYMKFESHAPISYLACSVLEDVPVYETLK